jgi:hypothetical protein
MKKNVDKFQINGRVIAEDSGRGIAGLRVEAWDKDLFFDDLVGNALTDAQGSFRIEFTGKYFREIFFDREPDLFFKVFSDQRLIKSTEDSVLWNTRAGLTSVEIRVPWSRQQARAKTMYRVQGSVASPDRAGVGRLRVQIVDKNVGQDRAVAETLTDERGRYSVEFAASVLNEEKQQPDLQARVYAGQEFLAASVVRYDAAELETLDVTLPAGSKALASEYETLTGALAAHFQGHLRGLKESGDRRDITYLANKTGWDARAVAMAALADQFSQQSTGADGVAAITPAFYYALFRAGLPANPDTLYHTDSGKVERILTRSIERGVIPAAGAGEIEKAVATFQRLTAEKLLIGSALEGASSMKQMLVTAQLNEREQQQFAELYAAHRTDQSMLWNEVERTLGLEKSNRLQLDGKLGFLTLNNAGLMRAVHETAGDAGLGNLAQLAERGYHRAAKWSELLNDNVAVPKQIPGETEPERRANYASYLAAQVRLSYPSASVAEIVRREAGLRINSDQVSSFLLEQQGKFEIGMQPVQQYIVQNQIEVAPETVADIKRLERVYQITPSDEAMTGLLRRGVDSAARIARYERRTFIKNFEQDVGGAEMARRTYDNAVLVHGAVLNLIVSYVTAKNGINLGSAQMGAPEASATIDPPILKPAPNVPAPVNAGDVIAYPTLEGLFGEMDFCACDHCQSILSPAAYLVDLLLFINQTTPQAGKENPQTVLLERRPDLEHLPLTCENTNTALPYIDVVNESLEYYIANAVQALSLNGYLGHDTDGALSEDLLASPQTFSDGVRAAAYAILRAEHFPAPLPFHQPLENLRRYFAKFEVPLSLAMERLRDGEVLDVDRTVNPAPPLTAYGWRDIWMEELSLSRAEYQILTDSAAVPLTLMYGFPNGTADAEVIAALSNAKQYSRRLNITYEDIVTILKTRFVNPNSDLIPKLERLGVSFAALKKLKDNNTAAANQEFDDALAAGAAAPDPAAYGGDIKAWVRRQDNYDRIMRIITLVNVDPAADSCSFDGFEFRRSEPLLAADDVSNRMGATEFVRLLRFIRLWKKLDWSIEQTDAAICALFPVPPFPLGAGAVDTIAKLDAGFFLLLPRLGILRRTMNLRNLTAKRDLLPLLTLWAPIGTHGVTALYRQMFLNPTLLAQDAAFADNGFSEFLQDNTQKLLAHAEALRSAFNLTGDEFDQIASARGFDANSQLDLDNVSAIYRCGWLARQLKLSVREFLLLTLVTGLNPFAMPAATNPAVLRLIEMVQALKDRSLKPSAALYLIWNQDLSGKSTPEIEHVAALARTMRLTLAAIDTEFAVKDDPDGAIAQTRMASAYGADAAAFFFGLVGNSLIVEVAFNDAAGTFVDAAKRLAIETAAGATDAGPPRISYDEFRKQLTYTGVLTAATRDAIKASDAATVAFGTAVDNLFAKSEQTLNPFFARYPELRPLYDAYRASNDPPEQKRTALLSQLLPEIVKRRKSQEALQQISAAAQTDLEFATVLLQPTAKGMALHGANHTDQPALNDILALETQGLSVEFFARDTATGAIIPFANLATNLDYAPAAGNPLPANPAPNAAISGRWRGYLEAPENGFFNFRIDADLGAQVTLALDGANVVFTQNGTPVAKRRAAGTSRRNAVRN